MYIQNFRSGYHSNRNPLAFPEGVGTDSVFEGENALHTTRETWIRKPGMVKWSAQQIGGSDTPIAIYDYFDNTTKRVIVDGLTTIKEYDTASSSTILAKGGSGNQTYFTDVRGTLYMSSNTVGGILHKRIGNAAAKVWGIDAPTDAPSFSASGTGIRLRIGRKYRYVYKDIGDGHISSASPASASTGAHTSTTITVTVMGTNQPRVTKIDIYATKDGGSYFFYLATIDNPGATTATYNDANTDTALNTALLCPSTTSNEPPPEGLQALTYHGGRIWGIVEQTVRPSANLIDGPINGIAEECFPVNLTFKFTSPTALVSKSEGLLVFTSNGEVYIIYGRSLADFDPDQIYSGISILTPNCVAKDGEIIFLYTANREILLVAQGITNIGLPLSDNDLADFDPANCYLTVHREGTKSALYLSNGNNKTFRYGLDTGTWSTVWEVDGATVTTRVVRSTQTALGESNLLFGPKEGFSGYLWKLSDDVRTNDGIAYTPRLRFGSFVLAEPESAALVEFVSTEATVTPTVKLLMHEVSGAANTITSVVNDPPRQDAPATLSSKLHYPQTIPMEDGRSPIFGRHCMVELVWDAVDDDAELYGIGYKTPETSR